jgi:RNA polymerase sigma factor (sigma-70 family)
MQADLGRYRDMMRVWARRAGAAASDASDIVQEAMVRAVRRAEEIAKLDEKQRSAWLKTTTQRAALDAMRYRTRAKRGGGKVYSLNQLHGVAGSKNAQLAYEPLADDTPPSQRAELNELRDLLLRNLPDDSQRVCSLILRDKWSPNEVAQHLGLSSEDVLQKASAGMALLRRNLKRRADGRPPA